MGSCKFNFNIKIFNLSFCYVKGCCAYLCCPCFCCQVFNRAGEWICTPFFCCWPDALMSLRMKIRTGFRLQVFKKTYLLSLKYLFLFVLKGYLM
jgi:hypothetical protein